MAVVEKECATPECPDPAGHGRRGTFCADHAATYARLADELKQEGMNLHRGSLDPSARKRKRSIARIPTCCTIGCAEPRIPPNRFCELCIQAGATEGSDT